MTTELSRMKSSINWKKLVAATLVGSVGMWILAGLWHEMMVPAIYGVGHELKHERLHAIFVAYLLLGLMMAYMYPRGYKLGRPIIDGLKFGLLIGILWVFPHDLSLAAAHSKPMLNVFQNAGWHLIEQGVGGIMIALVYGKGKAEVG